MRKRRPRRRDRLFSLHASARLPKQWFGGVAASVNWTVDVKQTGASDDRRVEYAGPIRVAYRLARRRSREPGAFRRRRGEAVEERAKDKRSTASRRRRPGAGGRGSKRQKSAQTQTEEAILYGQKNLADGGELCTPAPTFADSPRFITPGKMTLTLPRRENGR
ncbi:unnamed protein product [Protopolystoma xenopodis]|uniref:Uncharacterized protein n=1 Tax=Protopolystoma xenopodis TaxID=117903 RepID=A0A3S5FG70_9PLAT|nr:unnamed protein product [Protopolystoma xenopodis]